MTQAAGWTLPLKKKCNPVLGTLFKFLKIPPRALFLSRSRRVGHRVVVPGVKGQMSSYWKWRWF